MRVRSLWLAACALVLAAGCRTVETGVENRPWWHTTIRPDAVPWPWPTGDLALIDYHDAHGAGWWDAPWVLVEQTALLPSYFLWGLGETVYAELLSGSYTYERDQWQWKAVNYTLGVPHALVSSVNFGLVWAVDTVGHDPIAALVWAVRAGREPVETPPLEPAPPTSAQ